MAAGRHPAFGYDDQPPLTPLIGRASTAVFGDAPWALRVVPALAVTLVILIAAEIAREMGARARGQVIAALTVAVSGAVVFGRLLSTATFDYVAWAVLLWLLVRLLRGSHPREWLWAGVVTGVALQNKDLIPTLLVAVAIGLVAARRWDVVRSRWPWAGLATTLVIAAPNLAWQAAHGWPQRTLADQIAAEDPGGNRLGLIPFQFMFAGALAPILVAGLVWLLRSERAAPWRSLGWAYLALLALLLISAGKGYYAAGCVPLLAGAGGAATERWFAAGRARVALLAAGVVGSAAVIALIAFPVIPADQLQGSFTAAVNENAIESVGWPQLVDQVGAAYRTLPPAERARAVILAGNYGEAGAIDLLGPARGLPPVYAGQNAYWRFGRPPDGAAPVIVLGAGLAFLEEGLTGCRTVAHIDNGEGLDNEEQGLPIAICRGTRRPWSALWPGLHFLSA